MDHSARQRHLSALGLRADRARSVPIASLFAADPQRVADFTLEAAGLCLDLSRQRLARTDRQALIALARDAGVETRRDAMLAGERVNRTEDRAAWHTALRAPAGPGRLPEVADCLARMAGLARALRAGDWRGERGQPIDDVVCVGIGGSHLGPQLACEALGSPLGAPRIHFLSNVDPAAWQALRDRLDPHRTLGIVASKSWRTLETARNMEGLLAWFDAAGISRGGRARHLVAVTAAPALAAASGVDEACILPFWDWVGGRYSLWSAIGLPLMLAIGPEGFDDLLAGARAMDEHYAGAPLEANLPVALATTALWNRLLDPAATEVVVPYCDPLRRLPAYLQQLQMESNGKSVDEHGEPLAWRSAPVTWGAPGTDAQHSFFQALHQGTDAHPVEFVLALPSEPDAQRRDEVLLANAIAQAQALMHGRGRDAVIASLVAGGMDPERAAAEAAHRVHAGDRPSTTLLIGRLSPWSLGALIALYEHKTVTLAWLLGINPFDQWGVELGKQMAAPIEAALRARREGKDDACADLADPATRAWIERLGAALRAGDTLSR
jgi:glucose-6-phosphate isomerase